MLIFNELKNKSRIFYPAVLLEHYFSYKFRRNLRKTSLIITTITFVLMIVAPYGDDTLLKTILPDSASYFLVGNIYRLRGLFLIFLVVSMKAHLQEAFYISHYFMRGRVDYEVARLVYTADTSDLTASFLKSKIGEYTMDKLGITASEIRDFLNEKMREKIRDRDVQFYYNARKISNDEDRVVNLSDYAKTIFDNDRDFRKFLEKKRVSEDQFFGALEWVQNISWKIRNKERFWSKENLIRIPSVGRNWFLEENNYLYTYSHLIYEDLIYKSLGKDWKVFRDEAEKLEDLILDQKFNNTLVIADNAETGMQIVSAFGKMVAEGLALHKYEHKKIFILNSKIIETHKKQSTNLEGEFLKMINQASCNQDIILVIPDLAEFIEKTEDTGINIKDILRNVLKEEKVPLIAVVGKNDFYSVVEPDFELVKNFDKYHVPTFDKNYILRALQNEAHKIELKDKVNVTYPVIEKISEKYQYEKEAIKKALVELHKIYE